MTQLRLTILTLFLANPNFAQISISCQDEAKSTELKLEVNLLESKATLHYLSPVQNIPFSIGENVGIYDYAMVQIKSDSKNNLYIIAQDTEIRRTTLFARFNLLFSKRNGVLHPKLLKYAEGINEIPKEDIEVDISEPALICTSSGL